MPSIVLIVSGCLILSACGDTGPAAAGASAGPANCAKAYCQATVDRDMEAFLSCVIAAEREETRARWLTTEESGRSVSMVVEAVVDTAIDGERAAVRLKVRANDVPTDFVLSLVREDGAWRVTRKTHTDLAARLNAS